MSIRYVFKVFMAGSKGSGLKSVINEKLEPKINGCFDLGIGVDFLTKKIEIDSKEFAQLQIWSMYFSDQYLSLFPTYFLGSMAFIVVFDVSDKDSYDKAIIMIEQARKINNNIPIFLIGNKSDLEQVISYSDATEICKKHGCSYLSYISVKTGQYLSDLYENLANYLIDSIG